jgi:hypothetical protein
VKPRITAQRERIWSFLSGIGSQRCLISYCTRVMVRVPEKWNRAGRPYQTIGMDEAATLKVPAGAFRAAH